MKKLFLFIALLGLYAPPAQAQYFTATVVASCGTPPQPYVAGQKSGPTMDVNGVFCSSVSSGGGGSTGGSVTAAGTNGTLAQAVQGIAGGVALPVSALTLPLPTGAATSANQNVTAAGTTATNAQAVQGVTGGIAIPVSNTGAFAVQNTASIPAGAASIGAVGLNTGTNSIGLVNIGVSGNASGTAGGIVPSVYSNTAGQTIKAAADNLYSLYAKNNTTTAGWLIVYNSTTIPTAGASLTTSLILDCIPLPASSVASLNYNPGPAKRFSNGITALLSSTDCGIAAPVYTTGTVTGYISAMAP